MTLLVLWVALLARGASWEIWLLASAFLSLLKIWQILTKKFRFSLLYYSPALLPVKILAMIFQNKSLYGRRKKHIFFAFCWSPRWATSFIPWWRSTVFSFPLCWSPRWQGGDFVTFQCKAWWQMIQVVPGQCTNWAEKKGKSLAHGASFWQIFAYYKEKVVNARPSDLRPTGKRPDSPSAM